MTGLPYIHALVYAPLVGVQRRWPNTFHAVCADDMHLDDWTRARTLRAACGKRVAIYQLADSVLLWPVQHALPDGYARCAECWAATGKKRPRSRIGLKEAS